MTMRLTALIQPFLLKFLLVISVSFGVFSPPAFALSKEYQYLFGNGIYYFDPGDTGQDSSCDVSFSGSNNKEIAFNFFLTKKLSGEQAAGVIGNLEQESSTLDPEALNPVGPHKGIAQWDTGRWANLLKFAEGNSKDPLTLEAQLGFLWFEITGEPPTAGVTGANRPILDVLKKAKSIEKATKVFFDDFEGARDSSLPARIENAKTAFSEYGQNRPGTSASCAALGNAGPFGAFPLITTKKDIQAGSHNDQGTLIWNHDQTTNQHHDYNAADIHVNPGTKVVAALSGKVVGSTEGIGGIGSRVTLKSTDNKYVSYYAHMTYGSLTVKEGDQVTPGKVLGTVGPPEQAQGTAPHVHTDLLPGDQYDYRISCSGSACAGYPFIDIQGWLKELYDTVVPN